MSAFDLYYTLKPFIPWGMRMAMRRWYARRLLPKVREVWPIKPGSEQRPPGWPGWPDGKKFALVLTHDVESQKGVDQCPALRDLERQVGFNSAFYFIPEGPYQTPERLRREVEGDGCEVGVHDLHHDGKLYRSFRSFKRRAERINHYIEAWGAVGFRSGFMHRNLEWIHQLNLLYDGSTFDTDPFEPQPDGVETIFPFWQKSKVPGAGENAADRSGVQGGTGYVELPYTLPQDSTLFLVLRETGIDVWKKKVAWIASHGGMVLLNTHPDYMQFGARRAGSREYPADLYRAFLEWIKETYEGDYWSALPRDVGHFCVQARSNKPEALSARSQS